MPVPRPFPPSPRAFALLAVLWCVGIMTVAVAGVAAFVSAQLDEGVAREKDALARDRALAGLAVGLHPRVERGDPLLEETNAEGGYRVTLAGEDGRLNPNRLLAARRADVLERLWTGWGLDMDSAQALDDCLLDWVEPGDLKRLNGAKRDDYARRGHPEFPPGRPFLSLDEMENVIGFARVERLNPRWREAFTLWSDGRMDLDEAPADLIAAVAGTGAERAEAFVRQRDPDGRRGDPDGMHWAGVDEACSALGMTAEEARIAAPLLCVGSRIWRVESEGAAGGHRHTVRVVAARSETNNPEIYLWNEF